MLRLILLALAAGLAGTYAIRLLEKRRLELVAQIRAAFLAIQPGSTDPPAGLKDVHLRNETVRLRVPESWAEEYPDDGSARFQARGDSRRALEVASASLPAPPTAVADVLRGRVAGRGATTAETLPSGDVLLKAVSEARDREGRIVCFVWLIGRAISGDRVRVATFAFSAPLDTAHDVFTRNELIRLEHEVRAAQVV
jgi:hypothetical protein